MSDKIHPQARIGHVHLRVADLERAIRFYDGVLGFEVQQRFGSSAAFLSAGGYHHHIGLNTWESLGGTPPPPGSTGLYHLAVLYPTRAELAEALRRLIAAGIPLDGAADHGVVRRSTCAIPTAMAWSCIGTGRKTSGRKMRKVVWPCIPGLSTCRPCWQPESLSPCYLEGLVSYTLT